jgi:hypothetical protein
MTSWQDELHAAVVEYVVEHGSPVQELNTIYASRLPDDYEHVRFHLAEECAPDVAESIWVPSSYEEFVATGENFGVRDAITVTVTCECRLVYRRLWQLQASPAEMLKVITHEERL